MMATSTLAGVPRDEIGIVLLIMRCVRGVNGAVHTTTSGSAIGIAAVESAGLRLKLKRNTATIA